MPSPVLLDWDLHSFAPGFGAIDGANAISFNSTTVNTPTITITTQFPNELIIVCVGVNNLGLGPHTVSSISASGVVFDSSAIVSNTQNNASYVTAWKGVAPKPLTNVTITVTLGGSTQWAGWIQVFGIPGAATTGTIVDGTATGGAASGLPTTGLFTTANPNDFIFAFGLGQTTGGSNTVGPLAGLVANPIKLPPGAGSVERTFSEYRIVSTAQTNVTAAFGTIDATWSIIAVAIMEGAPGNAGVQFSATELLSQQADSTTLGVGFAATELLSQQADSTTLGIAFSASQLLSQAVPTSAGIGLSATQLLSQASPSASTVSFAATELLSQATSAGAGVQFSASQILSQATSAALGLSFSASEILNQAGSLSSSIDFSASVAVDYAVSGLIGINFSASVLVIVPSFPIFIGYLSCLEGSITLSASCGKMELSTREGSSTLEALEGEMVLTTREGSMTLSVEER
jgi:uncharacterized protein YfiM (DUF2279 family)